MRPSSLWRTGVSAVAGGLLLVTSPAPVASDAGPGGLQLLDYRWTGDLVEVTVFHPGSGELRGRLILDLRIRGERTQASVPFTISGQRRASIRWVSFGPVDEVHRVGIIVDDGTPF